jgi:hypothetical protein
MELKIAVPSYLTKRLQNLTIVASDESCVHSTAGL